MRIKKELFVQKLRNMDAELPPETHLLIVSKTRPVEEIETYYELGHRDFGENRVQELEEKSLLLREKCPAIRWHMIGHLQSNKINHLYRIKNLYAIHSVHDLDLLEKLLKVQDRLSHEVKIFLQYNTSGEEEKSGFENYEDLLKAARIIHGPQLKFQGLMTMGTLRTEKFEEEAMRCFRELRNMTSRLQRDLNLHLETSMGMSRDYRLAIQEKSNWIRIGTWMFTP